MGACAYVGRVGGLAVALGVGAAVLGGTAVGWADDDAGTTQTHRTARGSVSAPTANAGDSAPAVRGSRGALTVGPRSETTGSDSAVDVLTVPRLDTGADEEIAQPEPAAAVAPAPAAPIVQSPAPLVTPAEQAPQSDPVPPGTQPVTEIVPVTRTAAPPVAAPAPAVASVATAVVDALGDPFAAGGPGLPVDSAADWALLAFARRNPLAAASTLTVPQAAATTAEPTVPIILGPSGVPIPPQWYITNSQQYYIPGALTDLAQVLFTPEGLYPITGVKSLPLNTSVDQGIQILNDALTKLPAGTPTTVFGYSQSAIISSLLRGGYTVNIGGTPTTISVPAGLADSIRFLLVGNEMNPDGGFLSRFSGRGLPTLTLESLGIPFYGPTPAGPVPSNGVEYDLTNYTREYDGFADFPRYPINLLADINAAMGIVYVHVQYVPNTDKVGPPSPYLLTQEQIDDAIALPSTSDRQKYFFMPTENLPMLQPLRDIKFLGLGEALADLIQPSLKALVDFGYADKVHGYAAGGQPDANKLQPFDFLPPANLYGDVIKRFFDGIGQGIHDFIGNFGPNGSVTQAISSFSLPNLGALAMGTSGGFLATVQKTITSVSDYISGTIAGIYAALLPTADIINALVTNLPAYAANLFLYGMQEVFHGDVLKGLSDAIGLPIAAAVGLASTATFVGALVWAEAILPVFGQTVPGV